MESKKLVYTFEREFGRILSPFEEEFLDDWKKIGFTEEEILKALKESIYNGVQSFKYVNKILNSFRPSSSKVDEAVETMTHSQDLSFLDD